MFLRRLSRPLMMMSKVKETTGIEGLDVVPNAREVLIDLYSKTLNEIKAAPKEEGYRKSVESLTNKRLKICQEEEDLENIEKRIGFGEVKALIDEAKDELRLIGNMNEWKPWGFKHKKESVEVKNDAQVSKQASKFKAGPLPPEFYRALDSVARKSEEKRLKKEAEERAQKEEEERAKKEAEDAAIAKGGGVKAEPPSEGS